MFVWWLSFVVVVVSPLILILFSKIVIVVQQINKSVPYEIKERKCKRSNPVELTS